MAKIKINLDSVGSGKSWVRHKVQDGSNQYRLLPPYGAEEVHDNRPFKRWATVWLLDDQGRNRPYASPFSFGEDKCPVFEYSKALAEKIENLEFEYKAKGMSDDEIKDALKAVRSVQWKLKLGYKYAYNACDRSGSVGILEVPSSVHKLIFEKMKGYVNDYSQDPTSLNSDQDDSGIWFDINRTGQKRDTKYSVEFVQTIQTINGKKVRVDDQSALPENVVANYHTELGYDLFNIYKQMSYNELKAVLIENINKLAQFGTDEYDSIPELVVPGFGDQDFTNNESATTADTILEEAKEVNTLNLSDNDLPFEPDTTAPANTTTGNDVDDILNLADEILGS